MNSNNYHLPQSSRLQPWRLKPVTVTTLVLPLACPLLSQNFEKPTPPPLTLLSCVSTHEFQSNRRPSSLPHRKSSRFPTWRISSSLNHHLVMVFYHGLHHHPRLYHRVLPPLLHTFRPHRAPSEAAVTPATMPSESAAPSPRQTPPPSRSVSPR